MPSRLMAAVLLALWSASSAFAQSSEVIGGPTHQEVDLRASDGGTFVPVPNQGATAEGEAAVTPPALTTPSPAAYPSSLAGSGAEGRVELELLIDDQGRVTEVAIT